MTMVTILHCPESQPPALGARRCVLVYRLVLCRRWAEDRVCAHASYCTTMDLADVLWIGGPQGSGKSSVARALSRCFDLQLYNIDHHTWVHEPRMPRSEFASLSMDERWVEATPAQMLDWVVSTSRHPFRPAPEGRRE